MSLLAESATNTGTLIGALIGFVIWLVILFWTMSIARRKGHSPFLWGVLAFFFSAIALIIIAILPSNQSRTV